MTRPCWVTAYAGSHFVFGDLAKPGSQLGYFAFGVLPTVIFIAAFFAVLYHFGIMQIIIRIFAWVMTRVMGASGAESLNVAASIFMGQTEAPLTIRPFLPGSDPLRTDDGDDQRHGSCVRRNHGGIHHVWNRRQNTC